MTVRPFSDEAVPVGDRNTWPRVVITGVGVVSPFGLGADVMWRALLECESARRPTPESSRGIPVPAFAGVLSAERDAARELVASRRLRRVSDLSLTAVAAAQLAMESAGQWPTPEEDTRCDETAVLLGTSFGSSQYHFDYYENIYQGGLREASPLLFSESVMNSASGHTALHFGLRGPSQALVGGEEVGLHALADGVDRLRLGEIEAVLAGGGEQYSDFVHASLAHRGVAGDVAGLPYGEPGVTFFSEGGAWLYLERADDAQARGAQPLAEVLGYGIARARDYRNDAARGASTAIQAALKDAGLDGSEVELVVGSACGSPFDAEELSAVAHTMAEGPPCTLTAPKGSLGEGFAFTSIVQAIVAVRALQEGVVPPTVGVDTPKTLVSRFSVVGPGAHSQSMRYALVVALNRRGGAAAVAIGLPR